MAKITLGPVIGKLTASSARILIEVDGSVNVDCELALKSGGGSVQNSSITLVKDRPKAFQFTGLQPATEYSARFKVGGSIDERSASFRTFPNPTNDLNIAAVSCNFTAKRQNTDLWKDLRDRYVITGDLDLILHVGDQIYGDSSFQGALHILNGRKKGTARQEEQILELYRRLYRWNWNFPSTQEVLAGVSNLMIWDDHEIRDDWGSREQDKDPKSVEQYIGSLAQRVFREYQRQLWDSQFQPDQPMTSRMENHFHVWDQIGIMFLDLRGARSFAVSPSYPYLGDVQWKEIEDALSLQGLFKDVRALLVITSVPLVYLSAGISTFGSILVNDLKDHWAHQINRKEQIEFLRMLRFWIQSPNAAGDRQALVIGGDVHVGGISEVKHLGKLLFKQLIASPITYRPPSAIEFFGITQLAKNPETVAESYTIEHGQFTNRRNYGLVMVRIPVGPGAVKLTGSLVQAL